MCRRAERCRLHISSLLSVPMLYLVSTQGRAVIATRKGIVMRITVGDSTKVGRFYFKRTFAKSVYQGSKRTNQQEKNEKGVPLWSVRAELSQDGRTAEDVFIVVALDRDPAEGLQLNEEIGFRGLAIISGQRKSGGRWERLEADGIVRKKRNQPADTSE